MSRLRRDYVAEEEAELELGLASAPSDKLLFTVHIYDSFYVPNRKPLRFIGDKGPVGNTPGKWQIQLSQQLPVSGSA